MIRWRQAFLGARPLRAVGEAALLLAVLLSPPLLGRHTLFADTIVVIMMILMAEGIAASFLALRLRYPVGTRRQQIRFEIGIAVGIGLVMTLIDCFAFVLPNWWSSLSHSSLLTPLIYVSLVLVGLFGFHSANYLGIRLAMRLWAWWDRHRRRRLLWALTHDQLVAVVVVMLVLGAMIALSWAIYTLAAMRVPSDASWTNSAIRNLFGLSLYGSIYVGLTLGLLIVTLPLAILISLLLVRRIVRRIELLVDATDALRHGDYSSRVVVSGEDEIARLQRDFNAMAADLDRSVSELQNERDRVAGLLQARRELIVAVSHELRTPVATLRGYLESTMQDAAMLPSRTRSDLEIMEHETLRLQTLIDDLFTLSRAEVGRLTLQPRPLDASTVVEHVVTTFAPLAWESGRVEVSAQVAPNLPLILADEGRLEQVLRNLLLNASRHTPPGGIIVVALAAEDNQVVLQVNDTGSGIAPEDLPHIWERFYRAADTRAADHHGAGLGLALVKDLTEAMGGSVDVESVVGSGSSFTIRIPTFCDTFVTSP